MKNVKCADLFAINYVDYPVQYLTNGKHEINGSCDYDVHIPFHCLVFLFLMAEKRRVEGKKYIFPSLLFLIFAPIPQQETSFFFFSYCFSFQTSETPKVNVTIFSFIIFKTVFVHVVSESGK